jgi:hypothetical protein
MSSTNRGAERHPDDFYETPGWCVKALLKACPLPSGVWLEPAYGTGAIVKAATEAHKGYIDWFVNDLNIRWLDDPKISYYNYKYDAEGLSGDGLCDVVITNPPYNQAMEFVQGAMKDGKVVVMLLRLNWLASKGRNAFLREHTPSIYVLPRRPSFGPNAKHFAEGKFDAKDTDSCEYAWFVWGLEDTPTVHILDIGDCE